MVRRRRLRPIQNNAANNDANNGGNHQAVNNAVNNGGANRPVNRFGSFPTSIYGLIYSTVALIMDALRNVPIVEGLTSYMFIAGGLDINGVAADYNIPLQYETAMRLMAVGIPSYLQRSGSVNINGNILHGIGVIGNVSFTGASNTLSASARILLLIAEKIKMKFSTEIKNTVNNFMAVGSKISENEVESLWRRYMIMSFIMTMDRLLKGVLWNGNQYELLSQYLTVEERRMVIEYFNGASNHPEDLQRGEEDFMKEVYWPKFLNVKRIAMKNNHVVNCGEIFRNDYNSISFEEYRNIDLFHEMNNYCSKQQMQEFLRKCNTVLHMLYTDSQLDRLDIFTENIANKIEECMRKEQTRGWYEWILNL